VQFTYSAENPQAPVAYASFEAMHTGLEIILVGLTEELARRLCDGAQALVEQAEKTLSRHIPGSDLSRINAKGAAGPVTVDAQTLGILELCEAMRRATGGYFDIAALSGERARPAYTVDRAAQTVRTVSPEVTLDLGGFAKGYALDGIGRKLAAAGVRSAFLNFGDSSMLAVGTHPYGGSLAGDSRGNGPGIAR
jgi:thiamine biosynthesis lipoprotein